VADLITGQLVLDNVNWTPLIPPIGCSFITAFNPANETVHRRTDPGDPTTQRDVAAGWQDALGIAFVGQGYVRFPKGDAAAYYRSTVGVVTLIVDYLR
jgi:hypothetical protein